MTDKEMQRLGRRELLEIISEMKSNEQKLLARLERAEARAQKREICIAQSGSIAEAAMELNGVFAAAQAAADQYLENLERANREREANAEKARKDSEQIVMQAKRQAVEIVQAAEQRSSDLLAQADAEIQAKWDTFQRKVSDLLSAHAELNALLK